MHFGLETAHNFIETVHRNAPAIKEYGYDFAKRQFIYTPTGQRFDPPYAAFDASQGGDNARAAGSVADFGRAAILIQSFISEDGRGTGDGGILQAVLDYSGSLIEGGMRGLFPRTLGPERFLKFTVPPAPTFSAEIIAPADAEGPGIKRFSVAPV